MEVPLGPEVIWGRTGAPERTGGSNISLEVLERPGGQTVPPERAGGSFSSLKVLLGPGKGGDLAVLPERAGGSVNGLTDDGRTKIAGATGGSLKDGGSNAGGLVDRSTNLDGDSTFGRLTNVDGSGNAGTTGGSLKDVWASSPCSLASIDLSRSVQARESMSVQG